MAKSQLGSGVGLQSKPHKPWHTVALVPGVVLSVVSPNPFPFLTLDTLYLYRFICLL